MVDFPDPGMPVTGHATRQWLGTHDGDASNAGLDTQPDCRPAPGPRETPCQLGRRGGVVPGVTMRHSDCARNTSTATIAAPSAHIVAPATAPSMR